MTSHGAHCELPRALVVKGVSRQGTSRMAGVSEIKGRCGYGYVRRTKGVGEVASR